MNSIQKFVFACGLAITALPLLPGCTASPGAVTCTGDVDCTEDGFPICNTITSECVPTCRVPECEEGDPDCNCAEGEVCNDANFCEGPGGEGEGEGEGEPGTPCSAGIDDSDCVEAEGTLCDVAAQTCVEADTLTATCADAGSHTNDGGPLITDVEAIADLGSSVSGDCQHVHQYLAGVYSTVDFGDSLNAQRLKFLTNGNAGLTYSEAPDFLPVRTEIDGLPGYYTVDFYLCGETATPPSGAIELSNNDNVTGNAFCF